MRRICTLTLALLGAALPAFGEATLETLDAFPPGLAESVQEVLAEVGYRVVDGDRILGEFWLRKELPLEGINEGALGVEFGRVTASALVGVVHFPEGWIDYRDTDLRFTEILPGMVRTEFALNRFQGDAARAKEFYDSRPANLEPEAVANTILWAMEQPPEVNISSLVVQPTRNKG